MDGARLRDAIALVIGELTAPLAFNAALAQLQPLPFGAVVLGRDGCDHQGHLLRQGVAGYLAPEGGR